MSGVRTKQFFRSSFFIYFFVFYYLAGGGICGTGRGAGCAGVLGGFRRKSRSTCSGNPVLELETEGLTLGLYEV